MVGRRTDMIKSGTNRINPKEIESVEESAAIGIADDILGQPIKVCRKKRMQWHFKANSKETITQYKMPKEVEFIEQLPKTAYGKITKI